MKNHTPVRSAVAVLVATLILGTSACASSPADSDTTAAPAKSAAFPIKIEVPGGASLTIAKEPTRIAALSPDAAIALHELGITDKRLIAVPEAATNKTLDPYADDMAHVENIFAGDNDPEPEQVLSWKPDLVVVTARHTGEKDASDRLTAAGVPVLSLTNGWSSSKAVIENLELIGKATGTSEAAKKLSEEIRDGVAAVRAKAAKAKDKPSVMILSNQARSPFVNAGPSLVAELVTNGGGTNAADAIGITKTMPIQPEQLVAARPDYIMLVDVTGKGQSSFDALLGNPAVAALPAVANGHVKLFPGKQVYGLAGKEVVSGSDAMLAWLHPDLSK